MKIEIKGKQSPKDIETLLGFPTGSITSITRHGGSDPAYPFGSITVEAEGLDAEQESQLRTYLGDAEETNKRLSKSISGHVR